MTRTGGPIEPIENYGPQLNLAFNRHGVVLAYLFGSQAAGRPGPLSDVDIAVLFGQRLPREERFRKVLSLMADLAHVFRRDDVNVLDLEEGSPLLNNNVRLKGRVIYCPDERVRAAFALRALQRFVDTEPLRREQNRCLQEKFRRGLFGHQIPISGKGDRL